MEKEKELEEGIITNREDRAFKQAELKDLKRKLAEEKNIPLSQVPGSGDGGRIVKRDIENFIYCIEYI